MASKAVEKKHEFMLQKLLTDAGLECERPAPETSESSISEAVTEEIVATEDEAPTEQAQIEEEHFAIIEEIPEEVPEIFPTPSLRRVLPDKIRKYEEQNRIHVLPEEFKSYIDPAAIPKIAATAPKKYIEIIANLVGCTMYTTSLPEYWFLDTMANLLRRAQDDGLAKTSQAVLMLWFCEWIKEMQQFDAADRQRMLVRFKDNMLAAASFIAEEETLPTPVEAGVYYKAVEPVEDSNPQNSPVPVRNTVTFEGTGYTCSLVDLTQIIHYIYDLFSTDYQYDLVRSIFTHTPEYILIDAPYQMEVPKKMYVKLKPIKEKVKKPEAAAKGKKRDPWLDYEDFIRLMQTKAKEEKALAEQEEEDRETWNRKSSILPLMFAATEEFFDKYWPPPPPPPEPEKPPEPDPKAKGKGKKK